MVILMLENVDHLLIVQPGLPPAPSGDIVRSQELELKGVEAEGIKFSQVCKTI